MKHVQVIGGPGSGKSTLAKKICTAYNLEYVELDALFWKPDWKESTTEEFSETITKALDDAKKGWVVDGSYTRKAGHVIQPRLELLVYLGVNPFVSVPRAFRRSLQRIRTGELLWGTNKETVGGAWRLAYWGIKTFWGRDRRMKRLAMQDNDFEILIFRTNRAANKWLEQQKKADKA